MKNFTENFQMSALCLAAFNKEAGIKIVGAYTPSDFEGPCFTIAKRIWKFWGEHREPPGKENLLLLHDDLLSGENVTHRRVLGLLADNNGEINNVDFVLNELDGIYKKKVLEKFILESSDSLKAETQGSNHDVVSKIEAKLKKAFQAPNLLEDTDVPLSLSDDRGFEFFDGKKDDENYFVCGIREFDQRKICPKRKTLFVYTAPAKVGKTWALVHCGKHNIRRGAKVLHISLEVSEEDVKQRYIQSIFGLAAVESEEELSTSEFLYDRRGKFTDISFEKLKNIQNYKKDPKVKKEVMQKISSGKEMYKNLLIKSFVSNRFSTMDLENYIETVQTKYLFHPDIVILDYADIMKHDVPQDPRISQRRIFTELKAIATVTDTAIVTATQSNREGLTNNKVKAENVAESYGKVAELDILVSINRNEAEKRKRIARLYAVACRHVEDGIGVVINQNLPSGQFAINSEILNESQLKRVIDKNSDEQFEKKEVFDEIEKY